MRQAIVTRYMGPTDFKGSRVIARADAGSVTLPWDDSMGTEGNHARAAEALARKYGWQGAWIAGGLPERGTRWANVYVQVPTAILAHLGDAPPESALAFWIDGEEMGEEVRS